jgi:hypothetical protein
MASPANDRRTLQDNCTLPYKDNPKLMPKGETCEDNVAALVLSELPRVSRAIVLEAMRESAIYGQHR